MVGIIVLAITGMYIRFPTLFGARDFMRNTHYVLMTIVIVTFVWRVWYAFFSKTNADYKEFAIGKKDLGSLLGVLAYYGYFSEQQAARRQVQLRPEGELHAVRLHDARADRSRDWRC